MPDAERYALYNLYTPLGVAAAAVHSRHPRMATAQSGTLESYLSARPCAVLFRSVATPNFELHRFASLAASAGLRPLVIEFHRDKFVGQNELKHALARMGFYSRRGRKRGSAVQYQHLSVTDLQSADGLVLDQIVTSWGQSLIEFHHELLSISPSVALIEHFDASEWFLTKGPRASEYYAAFFSLFVDRAILFESFLLSTREHQFTSEVILPAFEVAESQGRPRPLVCRLDPPETEGDPHWLQYPSELQPFVVQRLSTVQSREVDDV